MSQQPARELHKRDVDPDLAPSFEEFESIDYLDNTGFGWAGSDDASIVQLRSMPFIPNTVKIEESVPIELQIEFSSTSIVYKMPGPTPNKFEWYSYLMVDNRVVAVYPGDQDDCPNPRKSGLDMDIPIAFETIFRKDGNHEIKIGLQITNDHYRAHFTVFETQTKAYGPFTP